jgi:cell division protein FtsL
VVWIALVALLLAGVVAVNVAVLRLNLSLDEVNGDRAELRRENEASRSQLASASAAGRTEALAREQLGLEPADPATTIYMRLGR